MKLRSFALHPDSFLLFEPVCEYTVLFMVLGVVKMEPCHGQQCFVEIQLLCRHLPTGVQALCTWKRAALWCRLEMRTLPVPRRFFGVVSHGIFEGRIFESKILEKNDPIHEPTFTSHSHHIKHFCKTVYYNCLAFSSIVTGHFRRAGCFF